MIQKWLENQQQRKAAMIDWLTAKAKHSWMFSILMVIWFGWELIEHVVLPVVATTFAAIWVFGQ
jgi:hypothetical protein